jgi:hypothetical protein
MDAFTAAFNDNAARDKGDIQTTPLALSFTAEARQQVIVRYAELIEPMTATELSQFAAWRAAAAKNGTAAALARAATGCSDGTPQADDYLGAWVKLNLLENFLQTPKYYKHLSRGEAYQAAASLHQLAAKA